MRSNSLAAPSFDTGNRFVNDNRPMLRLRLVSDGPKPRLENFFRLPHVRAYAKSTQPQAGLRKTTVTYDRLATEQNVYAYVGGNPVLYSDPFGLRPLNDKEKKALSPYIPKVDLDNADLHEDGTPWWIRSDARAVTLGNDIYFRDPPNTCSADGLSLLGHELVHVGQFRNGMTWLSYVLNIDENEEPAYAMGDQIRKDLSGQ